jgi:hypothetical protein
LTTAKKRAEDPSYILVSRTQNKRYKQRKEHKRKRGIVIIERKI